MAHLSYAERYKSLIQTHLGKQNNPSFICFLALLLNCELIPTYLHMLAYTIQTIPNFSPGLF